MYIVLVVFKNMNFIYVLVKIVTKIGLQYVVINHFLPAGTITAWPDEWLLKFPNSVF